MSGRYYSRGSRDIVDERDRPVREERYRYEEPRRYERRGYDRPRTLDLALIHISAPTRPY